MTTELKPKVRADISPSDHPEMLSKYDSLKLEGTIGAKARGQLEQWMRRVYEASGLLADAEESVLRRAPKAADGKPAPEPGQRRALVAAAEKAFEGASRAVDHHRLTVQAFEADLEATLSRAVTMTSNPMGAEIRAHFARLGDEERLAAITDNLTHKPTVAAVLDAPPYLSGLTAELQHTVREHAHRTLAPRESVMLEEIRSARAEAERAAMSYAARHAELMARYSDTDGDDAIAALAGAE